MKKTTFDTQRGQVLVLVALGIIAFLAILALVLDGGTTFAVRREMQNAADAGALAGARQLCITRDEGDAIFIAGQYAQSHNSAESCQVSASLDSRTVVVTATRNVDTFFAHFLGHDQVPVQASAEASCECPLGGPVLPVAWNCRPPLISDESSSEDCQQKRLSPEELQMRLDPSIPPDPGPIWSELYVFMDSTAMPDDLLDACAEPPTLDDGSPNPYYIDCNLDDDPEWDLIPNGGKAWLDLDGGGGGSNELANWIRNGFPGSIWQHTWVGDQPGTAVDIYQAAAEFEQTEVLVPVFTRICDGDPRTDCTDQWDGQDTIIENNGGNYYYHIMGFAAFYITCVDSAGVSLNDHNPATIPTLVDGSCPGSYYARSLNDDLNGGNFKSIEGYFVDYIPADFQGSTSTQCLDTGVYIINLTR